MFIISLERLRKGDPVKLFFGSFWDVEGGPTGPFVGTERSVDTLLFLPLEVFDVVGFD